MLVTGCGVKAVRLKMSDMQSQMGAISGLRADPLLAERVEFLVTDNNRYDKFFKDAAVMRAGLVVSTAVIETMTKNLKGLARTYVAAGSLSEDASDLPDSVFAQLKAKRAELSGDLVTFIKGSIINVQQVVRYLQASVSATSSLISEGKGLSGTVKTDFVGKNAIKAPKVAQGLVSSLDNLAGFVGKAPQLLKVLTRLLAGVSSIL